MKHSVGYTRNNIEVYVDLIRSEAAKHIARQPQLLNFVGEALQKIDCQQAEIIIEHDLGRTIGYNFVVSTKATDSIFYARVLHDDTYTRFVKNGRPSTTQYLTMRLLRNADDATYDLQDTWIGRINPPRPGSEHETVKSRPFWADHAFVHDNEVLQFRTVTKVCPY